MGGKRSARRGKRIGERCGEGKGRVGSSARKHDRQRRRRRGRKGGRNVLALHATPFSARRRKITEGDIKLLRQQSTKTRNECSALMSIDE